MRVMNRILQTGALAVSLAAASTVGAALHAGDAAPPFVAEAALGGQPFTFDLTDALKKGPVVLYFYPKAFTSGCTIEAHNFAEASDRFKALGATVIGLSNDDIETLKKFSVMECRNKFAVAADRGAQVMKKYDAAFALRTDIADRISYVIAPDGKVIYVYASLSPDGHVENTLHALQQWKEGAAH
jgi:thioredoxin-dependent peroxiredoxin